MATKLDIDFSNIKETTDGYVIEVSPENVPDNHTPVENVEIK